MLCRECGLTWSPDDTDIPGTCPGCGASRYERLRCPTCPVLRLDEALETERGAAIRRTFDLVFAAEKGMLRSMSDVTAEEFRLMQLIEDERAKHQQERDQANALPR